jgi:hypothetical protein
VARHPSYGVSTTVSLANLTSSLSAEHTHGDEFRIEGVGDPAGDHPEDTGVPRSHGPGVLVGDIAQPGQGRLHLLAGLLTDVRFFLLARETVAWATPASWATSGLVTICASPAVDSVDQLSGEGKGRGGRR